MGQFKIAIQDVQRAVAGYASIKLDDLLGATGPRAVSAWRDVAYYLCRHEAGETFAHIGRRFGRHHTTIIEGCRRVSERLEAGEVQLSEDIHNLKCLALTVTDNRRLELMAKQLTNLDEIRARISERGALDGLHSLWS